MKSIIAVIILSAIGIGIFAFYGQVEPTGASEGASPADDSAQRGPRATNQAQLQGDSSVLEPREGANPTSVAEPHETEDTPAADAPPVDQELEEIKAKYADLEGVDLKRARNEVHQQFNSELRAVAEQMISKGQYIQLPPGESMPLDQIPPATPPFANQYRVTLGMHDTDGTLVDRVVFIDPITLPPEILYLGRELSHLTFRANTAGFGPEVSTASPGD